VGSGKQPLRVRQGKNKVDEQRQYDSCFPIQRYEQGKHHENQCGVVDGLEDFAAGCQRDIESI
jgi:hypothetical protein